MSKKKKTAASTTPSDQFTWSDGSSLTLDTFRHDMEEGEGPSEAGRLPQTKGMSSLPPGLLTTEDNATAPLGTSNYTYEGKVSFDDDALIDLNAVLASEENHPRLSALDWLEIEGTDVDFDRMPQNPVDLSIPELEEAWGVHRRTTGIDIENPLSAVASRLDSLALDPDYVKAKDGQKRVQISRFSKRQVREIRQAAYRRVASGEDIRKVLRETASLLGNEAGRVRKSMAKLTKEAGLLGMVYIKASSYPGCDQGDWVEHVQSNSKTAKYIVKASKCSDCMFASKGTCGMFSRRLVASVPWSEAVSKYRTHFQADGIRIASGDPKKALRKAFEAEATVFNPIQTELPADTSNPFDRLDAKLAAQQVEQMYQEVAEVKARQSKLQKQKRMAILLNLKEVGSITDSQFAKLSSYTGPLVELQKFARKMTAENLTTANNYEGVEVHAYSGRSRPVSAAQVAEVDDALRTDSHRFDRRASSREVSSAISRTRRWLNEGLSGGTLDEVLRGMTPEVRTASEKTVDRLRDLHEGLAGHLYIDPRAYGKTASACEEGARIHRVHDIPYVLKMASCEGCVFRNEHDHCAKYAKELVAREDFEDSELDVFRNRMNSLMNMSDSERSASFFAPMEDPCEKYELKNSALEGFSYHEESDEHDFSIDDLGDWKF